MRPQWVCPPILGRCQSQLCKMLFQRRPIYLPKRQNLCFIRQTATPNHTQTGTCAGVTGDGEKEERGLQKVWSPVLTSRMEWKDRKTMVQILPDQKPIPMKRVPAYCPILEIFKVLSLWRPWVDRKPKPPIFPTLLPSLLFQRIWQNFLHVHL